MVLSSHTPNYSNRQFINRLKVIRGDITEQTEVDAIVAAIPHTMDKGSLLQSLDQASGEKLSDFILENAFNPRPGDVLDVPGFAMDVERIIFVVVPKWRTGFEREDRDLLRCYRHAMEEIVARGFRRIAFPALGTGQGKFPPDRAARLAVQGILERITPSIEEIRIVCNRDETYRAFQKRILATR